MCGTYRMYISIDAIVECANHDPCTGVCGSSVRSSQVATYLRGLSMCCTYVCTSVSLCTKYSYISIISYCVYCIVHSHECIPRDGVL